MKILITSLFILSIMLAFTLNEYDEKSINRNSETAMTLFLCGDVMTGRGIDQVFPKSVDPRIYESYVNDAQDYVKLAEKQNGNIPKTISYSYIWGDALEVWENMNPDFRIINLETSITDNGTPRPEKGIHYRMHPANVRTFKEAKIDFISLANNHILDWGYKGLTETLSTLEQTNIKFAGAGTSGSLASEPAILQNDKERILIFAYGSPTSGIPAEWAAKGDHAGVNYLPVMNDTMVSKIASKIKAVKKENDIVIFSVHWGSNWGYNIPDRQQEFAHLLIDKAGVDVIHGHSSHHPRGLEVYKNKLIIYGAGDFINDYEGISGYEMFRDDLTLMYFPEIDLSTGNLSGMKMVPMLIKKFQLNHPKDSDAKWLRSVLDRESEKLGANVILNEDMTYSLRW